MIKVTKRIEEFEITIETDEPFSKEALETLLYEAFRKERVYKNE